MVHPSDESPQACPQSFDLCSVGELKLPVYFVRMLQFVPVADAFVDRSTIREEVGMSFGESGQEIDGMVPFNRVLVYHLQGDVPGTFLLGSEDSCVPGIHLVAGDITSKERIELFFRYLIAESLIPVENSWVRQVC